MRTGIVLSFVIIANVSFGFGMSDWVQKTPGGHQMFDVGSGTQLQISSSSETLENINRWYFYKNHVVGELSNGFFILDESSGKLTNFSSDKEWLNETDVRGLKPLLWTRWYNDNWVDFEWLLILAMLGWIIWIPLALFFLYMIYRAVIKEKFNYRKPFTRVVTITVLLLGTMILLDLFPSSI